MKETINLAIRLFLITAASAIILAFANQTTEPLILQKQQEDYQNSLKVAYADADEFKALDENKLKEIQSQDDNVQDVQIALKGNEPIGYVVKSEGDGGYSGSITTVVAISQDKKIVGYTVLQSQETSGIGTRIEDPEFTDSLIGKSAAQDVQAVSSPAAENEIQALSGATYSTTAATNAINSAIRAVNEIE